jgi:hypothetical protein
LANIFFCDVTPRGSGMNRRYGRTHLRDTANVVRSSLMVFDLMMEATRSSETSVIKRSTRRYIAKDGILYSHRRENIKSYRALTWAL